MVAGLATLWRLHHFDDPVDVFAVIFGSRNRYLSTRAQLWLNQTIFHEDKYFNGIVSLQLINVLVYASL